MTDKYSCMCPSHSQEKYPKQLICYYPWFLIDCMVSLCFHASCIIRQLRVCSRMPIHLSPRLPTVVFIELVITITYTYYTIVDFGIDCYLDLSTWKDVIFTERRRVEYTFFKTDKPDSNLFQWLFYFMKMFYCYLLTTSSSAEKQILNVISLVIVQRKTEYDRIAKVQGFPIYFYALRGWYHFPDNCQYLFLSWKASFGIFMQLILAEGMISQVLKSS
jgi:hypothetical protein